MALLRIGKYTVPQVEEDQKEFLHLRYGYNNTIELVIADGPGNDAEVLDIVGRFIQDSYGKYRFERCRLHRSVTLHGDGCMMILVQ